MNSPPERKRYRIEPGYRPYGYTGTPGTCLWCGNKLRVHVETVSFRADHNSERAKLGNKYDSRPTGRILVGDYGDGHFCGLRCGYMFGRALADNDVQLTASDTK